MPRTYTVIKSGKVLGRMEFLQAIEIGDFVIIDGKYHSVYEKGFAHDSSRPALYEVVIMIGSPIENFES
jgi:hypothetical protein